MMQLDGIPIWTCTGSVRANCGIKHMSLDAARACCNRDHAGCKRQSRNGYSDRVPIPCNEAALAERDQEWEAACK